MNTIRFYQQALRSICIVILFCLVVSTSGEAVASSGSNQLALPETITNLSPDPQIQENIFLDELAKDTWTYLRSDWATDNHLPWSWRSKADELHGDYDNVTEIGFYALSWIIAYDLRRTWSPNWTTTESEVTAILNQLRAWQTGSQTQQPNGPNAYNHSVFYQWYWINNTPPVVGAHPNPPNPDINHVVPSIDNALLAASLITIREYAEANNHPILAQKADAILNDMDFTLWYHYDTHRFSLGAIDNPQGGDPANYFSNENRIINFVARALGQLSATEFQLSLNALNKPLGIYSGITVERMAWDGSYFTYTGPALFIREMDTLYGLKTIIPATQTQIQYASDQNYAAWGLSDTYDPSIGDYIQQGAPPVAMSGAPQCPPGAIPNAYECTPGLVSPHASALALITTFAPQAIANLQSISATFNCYDPSYGFHNSVITKAGASYGHCSDRFYALEQEWIFLSIADHENGFIWNSFYRDGGVINTHAEMYIRTISGNTGVAGAILSYINGTPKTVTSQANGNYSLSVPDGWTGTVTPSHACYTFSPPGRGYNNLGSNPASQNYTPSFKSSSGCADINAMIASANQGRFGLLPGASTRASFTGLNNGPVKIVSNNGIPLIGAERVIYKVNNTNTSFTEMMGLPNSQLNTTYWLPWYNNVDLDTQLRFGNVSSSTATIHVFIHGQEMTSGCTKNSPFTLSAGASTRVSCTGINNGPVKIMSNVNIVAAERVIYKLNGVPTSFSEMMALPNSQLSITYWLPWYDNVGMDTQLRFANVSGTPATVHVLIGGQEMTGSPFTLASNESTRKSFAVNKGPVKITSNINIVVAERLIYKVNGIPTSFTETMALPNNQVDITHWLPWYNNVDLDTQLRITNVGSSAATVHVLIGGVEMAESPFTLGAGQSTFKSYAVNNGPVKIVGSQGIVVTEREIYKINGTNTSFSEMMALPNKQLDTIYWLPWYNNVDLDTQLRFGVP